MPQLTRCRVDRFGGADCIRIEHDPSLPTPGPSEVRVAVEACSVQFTDTIIRRGRYPDAGRPPLTLGYDFVGRVDALGANVQGLALGARVADMCVIGGNASHVVCAAARLVPVPEAVEAAEATALVLSGVTAYQMLVRHAALKAGERVLVQGGYGAVGYYAVQLAVRAGARVWTTARPPHHAALTALGATPLDYADPTYPDQLRAATGGGVDVVFDGWGADGFAASKRCLRRGGRLVFIGTSEAVNQGRSMILSGAKLLLQNAWPGSPSISLYSVTTTRKKHPAWFAADLAALFTLLEQRALDVRLARRIGFEQVAEAHRELERGGVGGKIVLVPSAG